MIQPHLHLVGEASSSVPEPSGLHGEDDGQLLDAYSRCVAGVAGQNVVLPRSVVQVARLPVRSGVLVMSIEPGSPADGSDLSIGDVIIGLDDTPVAGIDDMHRLLTDERVGVACELTVLRGTSVERVEVVPEERD
jgi:S1-C subfamily serine protease